jgi:hypothetical protein
MVGSAAPPADPSYVMDILERPYADRRRPPTAVWDDRHKAAQWRDAHLPPTAAPWSRVICLNLEGASISAAALQELIVPLGRAVRGGAYGDAALMVAISDDALGDVLEALAMRHALPLYVTLSAGGPLASARPIGGLTSKETETLELLLDMGGETTSSRFADKAGIELSAAGNRLTHLAQKGYIHRRRRSKREGDVYIDPRVAATSVPNGNAVVPADPVDIPDDVGDAVRQLAALTGSAPGALLQQAWREFTERHAAALAEASEEAGRLMAAGDREGLAALANRTARERAEAAVSRSHR